MRRFTRDEENELRGFFKSQIPRFAAKIQPVYEELGWEWARSMDVPNIDHIEDCLRELVESLFKGYYKENTPPDEFRTGTGGLYVGVECYDNTITGRISFECTEEYYLEREDDGTGRSEEDSSSRPGGYVLAWEGS